jgi:hypothetical protein
MAVVAPRPLLFALALLLVALLVAESAAIVSLRSRALPAAQLARGRSAQQAGISDRSLLDELRSAHARAER